MNQRVGCHQCGARVDCEQAVQRGLHWLCPSCATLTGWGDIRRASVQRALNRNAVQARRNGEPVREKREKPRNPGFSPEVRAEIADRDRGCRRCGKQTMLDAHHVRYKSEVLNNSARNGIMLCRSCHADVHANKGYWQPVLLELLRLQYDEGRYLTVPQVEQMMTS